MLYQVDYQASLLPNTYSMSWLWVSLQIMHYGKCFEVIT